MRKTLTGFARYLRKQATPAEQKLWKVMRENCRDNVKFRRQQPIGPYIADFYCASLRCIVEIDGSSHDGKVQADAVRDGYMRQNDIRVFRFTESDVLRDPIAVFETVLAAFAPPPTKTRHLAEAKCGFLHPPPQGGRKKGQA